MDRMSSDSHRPGLVATYLRVLREQRGFTQREMAERVGRSSDHYSRWEAGHTSSMAGIQLLSILIILDGDLKHIEYLLDAETAPDEAAAIALANSQASAALPESALSPATELFAEIEKARPDLTGALMKLVSEFAGGLRRRPASPPDSESPHADS